MLRIGPSEQGHHVDRALTNSKCAVISRASKELLVNVVADIEDPKTAWAVRSHPRSAGFSCILLASREVSAALMPLYIAE